MRYKKQKVTCATHGEMEVDVHLRPDGTPWCKTECPICLEARHKKQLEEERRLEAQERKEQALKNRLSTLAIPKRFNTARFDNYQVGSKQQSACLNICRDYASNFEKHKEQGTSLLLLGSVGTGKTHLACSIGRTVVESGFHARYVTLAEIIGDIRATWSGTITRRCSTWGTEVKLTERDVLNAFEQCDLLIIDEIGVQSGTDNERNIIFGIIDARYREMLPTIAISNLNESEVASLISERSVDRLKQGGGTLAFNWHSYRGAA